MRILMLNNEFPPLGGGTGVVNFHFLQELSQYPDIAVDLVTSSRGRSNYEVDQFSQRITIYKVPVDNHNIHHSNNHELIRYAWRGLMKSYQLLKSYHYDLSFAFAGVPAGAISYALKLAAGLPYLVSLQGPDVPGFEARYNYLYPFLKPLLRRIWRQATAVTAISKEHQRLAHETMPGLEIPIIANGVDTRTFRPPDTPRDGSEVNILCVGRLIERKGQHHLLRAFANLRTQTDAAVRLTLVGTGDAEASLKQLASELGLVDAVTFAGFVPRDDMPEVYRQADIFVLPSQNEGMSIALLEAMASGLPVVVTDVGGTDELVKPGVNGFVVSWGDIEGLTQCLLTLAESRPKHLEMSRNSRRRANRLSWFIFAAEYVELIHKACRLSGSPDTASTPSDLDSWRKDRSFQRQRVAG